ncbi:DUF6359 domain-containing protein [Paraprevotella xylaniphila]|nr:DUF6359 domain-containing protein [Paraprevotella xylaniphila]
MTSFTSLKNWMLLALLFVAGQAAAQQVILSEDFSKCTSKDPDNPGTKMDDGMDPYTLTTGWSCVNGYAGEGNAKFGASKKGGILVTPSIDLSDASATYTLKFKACAWSKDATSLMVQVDEQEAVEITGLTNDPAPYAANMKDFSLEIKGTAASKITFSSSVESKGRFFLDNIEVTKLEAGEIPDASVSAPSAVAFGAIGVGTELTQKVAISGSDLTGDLTVVVEGKAFSCATTTIPKDDAVNAELEVLFAPTSSGDYMGTLTISGGGLKEPVVVSMTGMAVQLSGEGTKEVPYTVSDVLILENPNREAWVKGYIVGYVNGQSINEESAIFGAEGESVSVSNMLIASDVNQKDYTQCVVVQLPQGDVRTALNLKDNPENLGKQVNLLGNLEAYFGVCGVKEVSDYVLEDGETPEPVPTITFAKVNEIVSGQRYAMLVTQDENSKVAQNIVESKEYGYLDVSDVTMSNGEFSTEETNAFTITAVEGGYTIQDSYGRYLYMKGTFNSFNVSKEMPESGYVWTISIADDGLATITNAEMNKWIQYSAQYTSFGAYSDAQGILPELYIEKDGSSVGGIEVENNSPVEVYTLGGVKVGDSLNGLQKGIYIVKQGQQVKKVVR